MIINNTIFATGNDNKQGDNLEKEYGFQTTYKVEKINRKDTINNKNENPGKLKNFFTKTKQLLRLGGGIKTN